ncbi:MAG: DNA mismatch repair protein MutS, partial [Gemmatimonadetes bacterium]|nr:DNA mismatch repair protein MutS [Gemmatimonadota bacterium]
MAQYREIKAQHTNAILFFRMGDFYEMFYEDAEVAARALDLTLTSRNNGAAAEVPLAGIPVKAAADYIRRLVQQGYRVAICEQIEDPKVAKGIVKREVVETITPGAAFSDDLLDASRNTFLAAIALGSDGVGFAAADLSTGEFRLVRCTREDLDAVLARLAPRELLVATGTSIEGVTRADDLLTTPREGWEFDPALASDALVQHFGVASLEGFGLDATRDAAAIGAAGALLRYLKELQPGGVPHLMRPTIERPGGVMPLDEMTRRNLELVDSLRTTDDTSGTLLGVLDRTQTPMGARLLRQWILAPLTEVAAITARLDAVQSLVDDALAREALRSALDGVRDIERLAGRTAALRATPRDLRALGDSLARLPAVHQALSRLTARGTLAAIAESWDDAALIAAEIQRTLVERPPLSFGDGETVAIGIDATLDELRAIAAGGKDAIAALQAAERERTGIAS